MSPNSAELGPNNYRMTFIGSCVLFSKSWGGNRITLSFVVLQLSICSGSVGTLLNRLALLLFLELR